MNQPTEVEQLLYSKAAVEACNEAIKEMCQRAANKWGIDQEAVDWFDGAAHPAGPNAVTFLR